MIKVTNTCQKLTKFIPPIAAYNHLHQQYTDEQLFLLESLSGPAVDNKNAMVGFNPIFTLEITRGTLKFYGHTALCQIIDKLLATNDLVTQLAENQFQLKTLSSLWNVLRCIESGFTVTYLGDELPLRFGFFGYFGYDTIHYVEELPRLIEATQDIPDISLSIYQGMVISNLVTQQSFLITSEFPEYQLSLPCDVKSFEAINIDVAEEELVKIAPQQVKDSITKAEFLPLVKQALDYIAIGDIYQIQIGHEITITSTIAPFTVYQVLRKMNPSPYMYYFKMGNITVIGASPELFVRIHENEVTMRPIAGTIKRGATPEADIANQQKLLQDEKERAEHIMLVDLARNDIGRICQVNSLAVTDLMTVDKYSHVFHMVSTVVGQKAAAYDKYAVIAATFPAGTMTGTPKIRAMEIIETLENRRRGIYAGLIGFLDFRGEIETALCIRTAFYRNGIYTIRASAGIVADSIAENEWLESINKLSSTYLAITGKELKNENFIN
jgi:anthranilate synthase component 1